VDLRKTSWCNGCYLAYARKLHDEDVVVISCARPWWPGAVEVYVRGLPPEDEDQPNLEIGRLIGFLKDPAHCEDGDCLEWLEEHGEAGAALHLARQFGVMGSALQVSSEFILVEPVENDESS